MLNATNISESQGRSKRTKYKIMEQFPYLICVIRSHFLEHYVYKRMYSYEPWNTLLSMYIIVHHLK